MRRFLFVISLLLILLQSAEAQFKNILLDPGTSKPAYEPVIAINRDDPKSIVAISTLNNVYYSVNSGLSWKKSEIPSMLGVGGSPLLISDFKGTFHYFHLPADQNTESHGALDKIVVQQSENRGEGWSEGSIISGFDPAKDQRYPQSTVDRKGNWFAVWTQFDQYESNDTTCQSMIVLSTSSNGKKWSKPVQISQGTGKCAGNNQSALGASVTTTADGGRVFIAWANQEKIWMDRSFDGGRMWLSTDLLITDQPGGGFMQVPGLKRCSGMPTLVCDNTKQGDFSGALYMVWADQRNGINDTDIWFNRSTSFGDNWTHSIRINHDEAGKHQFMPTMTVDAVTGHIYVLYYGRENDDLKTDVFLAYSTDAGSNFKNIKISETPFTPSADVEFGDRINIAAHNGVITPIWTRMDNGVTSIWTAVIKHDELEKVK